MSICMQALCMQVPGEARKEHQILCSWSYRQLLLINSRAISPAPVWGNFEKSLKNLQMGFCMDYSFSFL